MIASGMRIKAFIAENNYWQDMGTPEKYTMVVFDKAAPIAFQKAFPDKDSDTHTLFHGDTIVKTKLKGDGSDRIWLRLTSNNLSIIMADHGIREGESTQEVDSFVDIGRHLYDKGIPVPKIHYFDRYSGLVFLEDLGDENLQSFVKNAKNQKDIIFAYKTVIDLLVRLSIEGAKGFDLSWTYQTQKYSQDLIIGKECLYFANAFLNKYLGISADSKTLADEFRLLADKALKGSVCGFMHRDMQSRNIMKKGDDFYFIDFQGGRSGPLQYDLASLLIDPYVKLPSDVQDRLVDYCFEKVASLTKIDKKNFFQCYKYCRITRNLQMLGAFGFLSYEKKKTYFEEYIPTALNTLQKNLELPECDVLPKLRKVVQGLVVP
jgi:aminoglycoside/choline kinase family phosphotransferase